MRRQRLAASFDRIGADVKSMRTVIRVTVTQRAAKPSVYGICIHSNRDRDKKVGWTLRRR
jgi:hypothetical protein